MGPFKQWYGAAEEVNVRGEMPQAFIDQLVAALTNESQSSVTKKRLAKAKAAKAARASKSSESSFWKEMRDGALANGNQGMADMAEQMMRTTIKSPSVMQHLFGDLGGPFVSQQPGTNDAATGGNTTHGMTGNVGANVATNTNNGAAADNGGIGMISGMVVFGPPRPPGML